MSEWNPIKLLNPPKVDDVEKYFQTSITFKEKSTNDFFEDPDSRCAMMHAFADPFIEGGTSAKVDMKSIVQFMFHKIGDNAFGEKQAKVESELYFSQYMLQPDIPDNDIWGYIPGGWDGISKPGHGIGIFYKIADPDNNFQGYDVYILNTGDGMQFHGKSRNKKPVAFFWTKATKANLEKMKEVQKEIEEYPNDSFSSELYYICILNALSGKTTKSDYEEKIDIQNLFNDPQVRNDHELLEFPPQYSGNCIFRQVFLLPYLLHVVLIQNISKKDFFEIYKLLAEYWVPRFSKFLSDKIEADDSDFKTKENCLNALHCFYNLHGNQKKPLPKPESINYSTFNLEVHGGFDYRKIQIKPEQQIGDQKWPDIQTIFSESARKQCQLNTTFAKAKYLNLALEEICKRLKQKLEQEQTLTLVEIFNFCRHFNDNFESDPQYPIVIMGCIALAIQIHTKKIPDPESTFEAHPNISKYSEAKNLWMSYHYENLSSIPVKSQRNVNQIEDILKAFYHTELPFYVLDSEILLVNQDHIVKNMSQESKKSKRYLHFLETHLKNAAQQTALSQMLSISKDQLQEASSIIWEKPYYEGERGGLGINDDYIFIWEITSLLYSRSKLYLDRPYSDVKFAFYYTHNNKLDPNKFFAVSDYKSQTIRTWFKLPTTIMTNTQLYNNDGCDVKEYTNSTFPCIGLFDPISEKPLDETMKIKEGEIDIKNRIFRNKLELNTFSHTFRFNPTTNQNIIIPIPERSQRFFYDYYSRLIPIMPYPISPYSESDFCSIDTNPYLIASSKEDNLKLYYDEGLHETFQCSESQLQSEDNPIHINDSGITIKFENKKYKYITSKQCEKLVQSKYFLEHWFVFRSVVDHLAVDDPLYILIPKYHYFDGKTIKNNHQSMIMINNYIIKITNPWERDLCNMVRIHDIDNKRIDVTLQKTEEYDYKYNNTIVSNLSTITEVLHWRNPNFGIIDLPAYNIFFEHKKNSEIFWNGQQIIQDETQLPKALHQQSSLIFEYVSGLPNVFLIKTGEDSIGLLVLELYYFTALEDSFINFVENTKAPPIIISYNKNIYTLDFHHSFEYLISSNIEALQQYTTSCLQYEKMTTAFRCLPYLTAATYNISSNKFNIPYYRLFNTEGTDLQEGNKDNSIDQAVLDFHPDWLQSWYQPDSTKVKTTQIYPVLRNPINSIGSDEIISSFSANYNTILGDIFSGKTKIAKLEYQTIEVDTSIHEVIKGITSPTRDNVPILLEVVQRAQNYRQEKIAEAEKEEEEEEEEKGDKLFPCNDSANKTEDCLYLYLNGYDSFRPNQMKVINDMVYELEANKITGVHHLKMGDGKTKLITPLVALKLLKNSKNAVLLVLPDILVNQTFLELRKYVQFIFGISIVLFQSNTIMVKNTIYVSSPTTIKKSIVNFMKTKKHTNIWKDYTNSHKAEIKVIIDEIDEICDPAKSEFNETKQNSRMAINNYDYQVKLIIDLLYDVMKFDWDIRVQQYETESKARKVVPTSNVLETYNYITKKVTDVLKKKNRVHYGFAEITKDARSFVVCPFKTLESPNVGSEFLNPTVTLMYMIAALCQDGLHDHMINVFLKEKLNEPLEIMRKNNRETLCKILNIDVLSPDHIINEKAKEHYKNKDLIQLFMLWYRHTGNIMFNMFSYNCSHTDILAHDLFHGKVGLTGTPDDFMSIKEHDGRNLGLLKVHQNKKDKEDIKKQIVRPEKIHTVEKSEDVFGLLSEYQCCIDVGMFFTDDPPKVIAKTISDKIEKDVLYIDPTINSNENNIKILLYPNGKIIDYTGGETNKSTFVFFGYHAITGFDIKMPLKCRGLVTFSSDTTLRSLSQGIYRLRNIETKNGQEIDYVKQNGASGTDVEFTMKEIITSADIFALVKGNQKNEYRQKQILHNIQNISTIMRQSDIENSWTKVTHNQIPLDLEKKINILKIESEIALPRSLIIRELLDELKCLSYSSASMTEKELEVEIELDHRNQRNKNFFESPKQGDYIVELPTRADVPHKESKDEAKNLNPDYSTESHKNTIILQSTKSTKSTKIILSPGYVHNYKESCNQEVCAAHVSNEGFFLLTVGEYNIFKSKLENDITLITKLNDKNHSGYDKGILTLLYMGIGVITLDIEYLFSAFELIQNNSSERKLIQYVEYILSENVCEIPNYIGLLLIYAKSKPKKIDLFEFISNYSVPYMTLLNADLDETVTQYKEELHPEDDTSVEFKKTIQAQFHNFKKGAEYIDGSTCQRLSDEIPRYVLDTNNAIVVKYADMIDKDPALFQQFKDLEIVRENKQIIRSALKSEFMTILKHLTLDQLEDHLDIILSEISVRNFNPKVYDPQNEISKILSNATLRQLIQNNISEKWTSKTLKSVLENMSSISLFLMVCRHILKPENFDNDHAESFLESLMKHISPDDVLSAIRKQAEKKLGNQSMMTWFLDLLNLFKTVNHFDEARGQKISLNTGSPLPDGSMSLNTKIKDSVEAKKWIQTIEDAIKSDTKDIKQSLINQIYTFKHFIYSPLFDILIDTIDTLDTDHITFFSFRNQWSNREYLEGYAEGAEHEKDTQLQHRLLSLMRLMRLKTNNFDIIKEYRNIGLFQEKETLFKTWSLFICKFDFELIMAIPKVAPPDNLPNQNVFLYCNNEFDLGSYPLPWNVTTFCSPTIAELFIYPNTSIQIESRLKNIILPQVETIKNGRNVPFFRNLDIVFMPNFEEIDQTDALLTGCPLLKRVNISSLTVSSVSIPEMKCLFNDCNFSECTLVMDKVQKLEHKNEFTLFKKCVLPREFKLESITEVNTMILDECSNITKLSLPNVETIYTSDKLQLFNNCASLTTVEFDKLGLDSIKTKVYNKSTKEYIYLKFSYLNIYRNHFCDNCKKNINHFSWRNEEYDYDLCHNCYGEEIRKCGIFKNCPNITDIYLNKMQKIDVTDILNICGRPDQDGADPKGPTNIYIPNLEFILMYGNFTEYVDKLNITIHCTKLPVVDRQGAGNALIPANIKIKVKHTDAIIFSFFPDIRKTKQETFDTWYQLISNVGQNLIFEEDDPNMYYMELIEAIRLYTYVGNQSSSLEESVKRLFQNLKHENIDALKIISLVYLVLRGKINQTKIISEIFKRFIKVFSHCLVKFGAQVNKDSKNMPQKKYTHEREIVKEVVRYGSDSIRYFVDGICDTEDRVKPDDLKRYQRLYIRLVLEIVCARDLDNDDAEETYRLIWFILIKSKQNAKKLGNLLGQDYKAIMEDINEVLDSSKLFYTKEDFRIPKEVKWIYRFSTVRTRKKFFELAKREQILDKEIGKIVLQYLELNHARINYKQQELVEAEEDINTIIHDSNFVFD